jgi:uncharacterized protein YdbL (DUF1318 family)
MIMRKNIFHFSSLSVIFACFFLFTVTTAYSASIKDQMAARIPTINSLKDQGVIGENSKGFLEFRGAQKQAKTVGDENKDRSTVYKAIAKKQGVAPALVGKRRAKMIAGKGKKGHLFQKPDGSWYKK